MSKQPAREPAAMTVAGVMSGTSADGVDVAVVRIAPGKHVPKLKLLEHRAFPYPKSLRNAVLAAMDAQSISAAEMARLHWRLGEVYADCIARTLAASKLRASLIGVHGQTIYHQGAASPYLGKPLKCTWQLGEASCIAERLRIPVISDFRPADMAAGGHAAPLVPMLDYTVFAHAKRNRVLQNLGGIANLSAVPANTGADKLLAFDTGPANMVVDELMQRFYQKPYDRNGATAKRGIVLQPVLDTLMRDPYFVAAPPKSTGREQYGAAFVDKLLKLCGKARGEDIIATATALTAESIAHAYRTFVWPHLGMNAPLAAATDFIPAGGGAKNATLMRMLQERLEPLGITFVPIETFGLPAEAKEAAAFALLAWLTWHGLPGNVPSATGASRPVVLGRVTDAP
jgi:anhydro-N-acetylmuramic acid kinase